MGIKRGRYCPPFAIATDRSHGISMPWYPRPKRLRLLQGQFPGRVMTTLSITSPTAEELTRIARMRLTESPYFFLKGLECRCAGGVLTLQGRVPMLRLKQFAEDIVSRIDGIESIDNRIEVVDPFAPASAAPRLRNAG